MYCILFDIDGTLLKIRRRTAREVVARVLEDVLGHRGELPEHEFHGKTDRQIFFELCELLGYDRLRAEECLTALEPSMEANWRRFLKPEHSEQLPGTADLLARLAERPDVSLGLVTGNLESSARIKLALHNLNVYFPFGAFGSDAEDRLKLPPIAVERAYQCTGTRFVPQRTLIIGDSHRDIACARASGIPVLAVATGGLSAAELHGYQPDAVCETLEDDSYIQSFLTR